LIDDHAVMRAGLANMLNANPAFRVVAGADDGTRGLALFREHRPDVTLLDVSMPGVGGIECLRLLRADFPDARVLMLSSSDADEDIVQALEAGACGYVTKTARPAELTAAIIAAHAGERVISAAIESRLAERASGTTLTAREIEVLHLLRKGMTNPDIGRLLGITPRTAKAHVAAILEKLEAADRTEAVTRAFERGLLKV
jgi:DNA-binding NarL/FixJ family response regulator